jgi:hypothetical protein
VGLLIYLAAFLVSDRINSPASFIRTALEPSRVFWNLQPEDFDSSLKRMKMTVFSVQWGDALFPENDEFSFTKELEKFSDRLTRIEFPPLVIGFAFAGVVIMLITRPGLGAFYPLTFFLSAFLILNYQVFDKNVFYLSLYISLTVAAGTGIGSVLDWVHRYLESAQVRGYQLIYLLPVLLFAIMVVQPVASIRWQALRRGAADFIVEGYVYPVKNLKKPRQVAQMRLARAEENAVFLLDWRDLYTTAYLAYVEKGMKNSLFIVPMPRGNDGKVASTLVVEVEGYLREGRPVYVDQRYPGLDENFRILPTFGKLYELSLRE